MEITNLVYKFTLHDPTCPHRHPNYASIKANFNGNKYGMFIETYEDSLTDEEYDLLKSDFLEQVTLLYTSGETDD